MCQSLHSLDSRLLLFTLPSDCRSVTHRRRSCWGSGWLSAPSVSHAHAPPTRHPPLWENARLLDKELRTRLFTMCGAVTETTAVVSRHVKVEVANANMCHFTTVESLQWRAEMLLAIGMLGEVGWRCRVDTQLMKRGQGAISKMKKVHKINVCSLCWDAWFTPHMATEWTCWIKGDSAVLHEHNSCTGKSMVISNLATFFWALLAKTLP